MSKLEVQKVTMDFPGVRALDQVSLSFETGEVHGIIGENGAGKSTLMKILSGVQAPTSGSLQLDGATVEFSGVRSAQAKGISMVHQELNLVDELTVAENVFLGREKSRFGIIDGSDLAREASEALKKVGASFGPKSRVGDLSVAGKQLVEIAKALAVNASILILDEPTAVLSEHEAQSLFGLIGRLKESGVTVLYISHRLVEICEICDRITVMRDGAVVTTVDSKSADPTNLASLMVGRPLGDFYPQKLAVVDVAPIMEIQNGVGGSFQVRQGEILGIAGLVGAGRTELAEAIIGAVPQAGLKVTLGSQPIAFKSPKHALEHGVAYLSEDRKGTGLHTSLSAVDNVTIANLKAYGGFTLNGKGEKTSASTWKDRLNIRVADLLDEVGRLSGGNQQKIAFAKWLETKPKVLILDEPTRGVDVGAKREMYALIQELAQQGMACLVISSELTEIIGLCTRAVVMREGKIMGELEGDSLTEESVMQLAAGVQAA